MGGGTIRGSRVGASSFGEAERGHLAARQIVSYFCARAHRSDLTFAHDAVAPETWDCPSCGLPASLDRDNPPDTPRTEVFKSHLAYAKERRSDEEAESILDEAVKMLRTRRKSGEVAL